MCKRCGDLKLIACSKCKGQGIIRENMFFNFNAMDDLSQSYGGNSRKGSLSCKNCRAKGHFSCPECSNVSQSWYFFFLFLSFSYIQKCVDTSSFFFFFHLDLTYIQKCVARWMFIFLSNMMRGIYYNLEIFKRVIFMI